MKPVMVLASSPQYAAAMRQVFTETLPGSHEIIESGSPADLLADPAFAETVSLLVLNTAVNPRYDGFRLITAMKNRQATRQIPIVVVSTAGDRHDRIKAISLDVSEYLVPPFPKKEFGIRCLNLIEQYRETRNLQDGLQMLRGLRAEQARSAEQGERTKRELDELIAAQEAVFEMSREELLEANRKLKESYESKLKAVQEKGELQLVFGRYISPAIIEHLMQHNGLQSLAGQKQDLSILFADIRGFTAMSEAMEAHKVVVLLNEFFTELTEAIISHNGIVDKYSGDNIMAVFGAPVPAPDHHEQALLAALEMQRRFRIIKKNWSELFRVDAGIGIGINSGPAIVGNIGCFHRLSYTAIGDTVNTAARFEQFALDNQILFGDSLRERLAPDFIERHGLVIEELSRVPIKGKKGIHTLYNIRTT